MKIAFFDSKAYDEEFFSPYLDKNTKMKFFETKLNEDTVSLANGYNVVCVFVNDDVNAAVIDKLCEYGVKLIALRCAGYNNVDLKALLLIGLKTTQECLQHSLLVLSIYIFQKVIQIGLKNFMTNTV